MVQKLVRLVAMDGRLFKDTEATEKYLGVVGELLNEVLGSKELILRSYDSLTTADLESMGSDLEVWTLGLPSEYPDPKVFDWVAERCAWNHVCLGQLFESKLGVEGYVFSRLMMRARIYGFLPCEKDIAGKYGVRFTRLRLPLMLGRISREVS